MSPQRDPQPSQPRRTIRPFPWGSLDVLGGADVAALREARRWTRALGRPEAVAASLTELTGAAARFLVREASRFAEAATIAEPSRGLVEPPGAVGVLLRAHGDLHGPLVLVEAERALATSLVARVLRRPLPLSPPHDGSRVSPALAGAFAAVVAAVARRLHPQSDAGGVPVPVEVLAAGDPLELLAHLVATAGGAAPPVVVSIALTVILGDDAFAARVLVAVRAAGPGIVREPAAASTWNAETLRALGATPLALPIVAFEEVSTVADVASLRPGDVWLLGGAASSKAPESESGSGSDLGGPVLLLAPGSELGIRAELVERGRLVLSDELGPSPLTRTRETDMPESDAKTALLNAIGDVPVVVRVEVGEARMLAREWAELGRGDVVTLGRRVGEHVILRVGGVAVARGELVTVDGEVGVRIAERIAGESPNA